MCSGYVALLFPTTPTASSMLTSMLTPILTITLWSHVPLFRVCCAFMSNAKSSLITPFVYSEDCFLAKKGGLSTNHATMHANDEMMKTLKSLVKQKNKKLWWCYLWASLDSFRLLGFNCVLSVLFWLSIFLYFIPLSTNEYDFFLYLIQGEFSLYFSGQKAKKGGDCWNIILFCLSDL